MPSNLTPLTTAMRHRSVSSRPIQLMMMFALFAQYTGVQAEELITYFLHDNNFYVFKELLEGGFCEFHDSLFYMNKILNPCNASLSENIPQGNFEQIKSYDFCYEAMGTENVHLPTGNMRVLRNASQFIDQEFENCLIGHMDEYFDDYNFHGNGRIIAGSVVGGITGIFLIICLCALYYKCKHDNANQAADLPDERPEVIAMTVHMTDRFSYRAPAQLENQLSVSEQLFELETRAGQTFIIPEEFCCPSGKRIIDDPISVSTGITYDRTGLRELFDAQNNPEFLLCVKTQKNIRRSELNLGTDVSVKELLKLFIDYRAESVMRMEESIRLGNSGDQALLDDSIENWNAPQNPFTLITPTERIKRLEKKGIANVNLDIPYILRCPSLNYMDEPITITSGITYERTSIVGSVAAQLDTARSFPNNVNVVLQQGQRLFKPSCPISRLTVPGSGYDTLKVNVIIQKWTSIHLSTLEKKIARAETSRTRLRDLFRNNFFNGRYSQLLDEPEPKESFGIAARLI